MNYIIPIKTAIVVFPFIALLFSVPFILHQYHKYGSINLFRVLIIYLFIYSIYDNNLLFSYITTSK